LPFFTFGGGFHDMEAPPLLHDEKEWPYILTLLPRDLEDSARRSEALMRCRNVPNAAALIRMALAYAVSDLSLKDVAAWASTMGLADISGPGLFYRLRESEGWLEQVLAQSLGDDIKPGPRGFRLRAVDATVINGPGADGTEWRAHVRIDPQTGTFCSVELTDEHGGEGYGRHPVEPNEVVLGDRAYSTARGIYAVQQAGAKVVARLNPYTLRVCDANRKILRLLRRAKKVPKTGALEFNIIIPIPPAIKSKSHKPWSLAHAVAWLEARVVAARTRHGEIIWIITTLAPTEATAVQLLELYRLRWQIEMLFKRLKSLLHLDTLPSRQGPTARSWMLARLLAAALSQKLVQPSGPLSPYGYQVESPRLYA
jgi:hypothetical protein